MGSNIKSLPLPESQDRMLWIWAAAFTFGIKFVTTFRLSGRALPASVVI